MDNAGTKVLGCPNAVPILVKLYETERPEFITAVHGAVGSSYNAIKNSIHRLQEDGLIEIETKGRIQLVSLTPVGKKVAKDLKVACETYDSAFRVKE